MKRFPPWIRKRAIFDEGVNKLRTLLRESRLHTVCQSAQCPNRDECFKKGRATFLILGDICTRNCRFCAVKKGIPNKLNKDEPKKIAQVVKTIELSYVIITSVTRDDLIDGGAEHFAACIDELRKNNGSIKIEVLTPDFKGNAKALKKVLDKKPDVFAHNIETVQRLYKKLRPEADYKRSLSILKEVYEYAPFLIIKSGIMVGLGEKEEEVFSVMTDLKKTGCSTITIGQYLRPSKSQTEVSKFIHPLVFEKYKNRALGLGFKEVASGPFVRSSYVN